MKFLNQVVGESSRFVWTVSLLLRREFRRRSEGYGRRVRNAGEKDSFRREGYAEIPILQVRWVFCLAIWFSVIHSEFYCINWLFVLFRCIGWFRKRRIIGVKLAGLHTWCWRFRSSAQPSNEGKSGFVRKAVSFVLITVTGGVALSALDDLIIYHDCSR